MLVLVDVQVVVVVHTVAFVGQGGAMALRFGLGLHSIRLLAENKERTSSKSCLIYLLQ